MLVQLGPDIGWDSIGDFSQARSLAKFLNRLDNNKKLAKTIIYNLNPADNELFATMIGNFNDGSKAGKIQWGSSWWFLDQKEGITRQINALSNLGLLSRFVGLITDSGVFCHFPAMNISGGYCATYSERKWKMENYPRIRNGLGV